MRNIATALLIAGALTLSACGGKSSTDSADDSQLTEMNGIGAMEGTVNDASALDGAMNSATAATPAANSAKDAKTDEGTEPGNAN